MRVAVGASSFSGSVPGCEVVLNPYGRKLTEDETIAHLHGCDGLLAGLEPLSERVFSACPDLRAVARIGIGMENVDLAAAKRYNIKVSNTPDAPTDAVAEMTLAALLSIGRQIIPANADMHTGIWKKRMGFSLMGCSALIVGYGRIGKRFASLLEPFKVNLLVYDLAQPGKSFEELLPDADVISLHASGSSVILGEEQFDLMKKQAIVLNSARGGLVDESALCRFLDRGGYYWADAFVEEPYVGALTSRQNAVLTPHISTYTTVCREKMEAQAVENLLMDLGQI